MMLNQTIDMYYPPHSHTHTLQAILHAHPYHIDSLLQMSEVSRLGEDIQMASELIGVLYIRMYTSVLNTGASLVDQFFFS